MTKECINFYNYIIYDNGQIYSQVFKKFLKLTPSSDGYIRLRLRTNGKYTSFLIHRLIATLFIPNIDNLKQVNHINGIKSDNCVLNLEWSNQSKNMQHSINVLGNNIPEHYSTSKPCLLDGKYYPGLKIALKENNISNGGKVRDRLIKEGRLMILDENEKMNQLWR